MKSLHWGWRCGGYGGDSDGIALVEIAVYAGSRKQEAGMGDKNAH